MLFNKLKAISYVEIILVLVIVGVVSSLAIPTLKRYSQREELGRLAQKAYLTINDAMDSSIVENGPSYKWKIPEDGNAFGKYIAPYLKQSSATGSDNAVTSVITKDGMEIELNTGILNYGQGVDTSTGNLGTIFLNIDVNGDKGPNMTGKDQHSINIDCTRSKVVPSGVATTALFQNNWKFTDDIWNRDYSQKTPIDNKFENSGVDLDKTQPSQMQQQTAGNAGAMSSTTGMHAQTRN